MTNVVIGAASGMGAAVARCLAPRGRLLVADRDPAGAEELASELGGDVRAFPCDVTNPAQIDELFANVDDLEALVNTAGISGGGIPQGMGRQVLEVNLVGMARVLRAAEPLLGPGSVGVGVASQSGYMVPENPDLFAVLEDPLSARFFEELSEFFDVDDPSLAYQMSKKGVHRLVRRSAASWGERGARIMSVSPGINDTPMNRALEDDQPIMLDIIRNSPLGRRGTPEEIANVIDFITSPAASLLTGSDVLADGGMVGVLPSSWDGKLRIPASS
jgi:NAD(P)-dependent dehydrogenase (short-subunit alcohol dehydrogenase family)